MERSYFRVLYDIWYLNHIGTMQYQKRIVITVNIKNDI